MKKLLYIIALLLVSEAALAQTGGSIRGSEGRTANKPVAAQPASDKNEASETIGPEMNVGNDKSGIKAVAPTKAHSKPAKPGALGNKARGNRIKAVGPARPGKQSGAARPQRPVKPIRSGRPGGR